jgi:hypothetical protein
VDIQWSAGQLTRATIHCDAGGECELRYGDKAAILHARPDGKFTLDGQLKRVAGNSAR